MGHKKFYMSSELNIKIVLHLLSLTIDNRGPEEVKGKKRGTRNHSSCRKMLKNRLNRVTNNLRTTKGENKKIISTKHSHNHYNFTCLLTK